MTFMYLFAGVRASDFRDSDDSLSMGFLIFIGVICLLLLVVIIYADIMNKKGGIGFKFDNDNFKDADVIAEVKKSFKPELINRLDKIVVFRHLDEKDIYKILDKQLDELKNIMERRKIFFNVSANVKKDIVGKCNYFQYGARTVRREIENAVEDVIVDKIINKEVGKR